MRLQIKRYGAVALAGIMAGSFALTGCGSYASSSELRLQAEASLSGQIGRASCRERVLRNV